MLLILTFDSLCWFCVMASNAKLLSGKQLVENGGKKSDSFLPTKGAKSVIPSGSWLEKKQVESALEARKCVLGDQRIEKRSSLTQAEWLEDQQKALVTGQKGGQWLHMGQRINFNTYLLPEETLHLMEMNSLELKYGGVPVSVQQAYSLLIGKSVSLDEYRVYSSLSRQGYKLMRYDKTRQYANENSEDSDESQDAVQHKCSNGVDESQINIENVNCVHESLSLSPEGCKSNGIIYNTESSESLKNKNEELEEKSKVEEICIEDTNDESVSILDPTESEHAVLEINQAVTPPRTEDRRETSCMDIDSSSDDCMVIGDSLADIDNAKCATDGKKSAASKEISVDYNLSHGSDTMEIECLPSFSFKLKILESIPNCYHKNIIYLKAPDKKFIPHDINLSKENYFITLSRLSNKSNMNDGDGSVVNFYDDYPQNTRDPKLKCITNFSHDEDVRSTANTQNNRNFNSHYMGRNNFANNTYFWNHIFHQLSSRQVNFFNNFQFPHINGMFGRINNFSNNFSQRPFFFPQFNNRPRFASNFFIQPFGIFCSRSNNLFSNHDQSHTFAAANSCSSGRENTFTQMFNNRNSNCANAQSQSSQVHRKRCRYQNNQCHKNNPLTSKTSSSKRAKTSESSPSNNSSKDAILSQIKALISRYSIISPNEQSDELRKALKSSVDKFNMKFNENYMLDFKTPQCLLKKVSVHSNRCQEVPLFDTRKNVSAQDKVLQLSSDSDCTPYKVSRLSNNYSPISDSQVKRKVRRKLRTKRSKSETKLRFQVNTMHSSTDSDYVFQSSSDEEHGRCSGLREKCGLLAKTTESTKTNVGPQLLLTDVGSKNIIETFSKYKRKVVVDHSKDTSVFGSWYPKKDSWNKPVYSAVKPKHSHIPIVNLKISYAILNNIRELSYEKEYSIESWGQAKKLFERKNDSGTVCISDDESVPNDSAETRLNEITIKIDKVHPLVRPQDCKSVTTVLDRLQVISSACDDQTSYECVTEENGRLKISYDMYLPSFKTLRKSNPPPPTFSVIVVSDTSPMPCPSALSEVSESLPPSVPFLLAVVSFDSISFIRMEHITLPNMTRSAQQI